MIRYIQASTYDIRKSYRFTGSTDLPRRRQRISRGSERQHPREQFDVEPSFTKTATVGSAASSKGRARARSHPASSDAIGQSPLALHPP